MKTLTPQNILLGVTGSIAAYKAAVLTRLLVKAGHKVKIILTPDAKAFITPLTLSTLSCHEVLTEFFDTESGKWVNHIELAQWADQFLIAPATAATIAKMANGISDNLLLAIYLSYTKTVTIAPAMDRDMYLHTTTQHNIELLKKRNVNIIEPETGELASGLTGIGRMAEPENIFKFLFEKKNPENRLKGKTILITAGPTHEAIDPVRFIGNYSSGKMGFAIAETFADEGADVILIKGPVNLPELQYQNIKQINVTSASEMQIECNKYFQKCDVLIMAAAVADFTPKTYHSQKIKKEKDSFQSIELIKTNDILAGLAKKKKKNQFIAGFSLETSNEIINAKNKLKTKELDLIILNSMNDKGAGFKSDTNKITIIDKNEKITKFKLKSKKQVAEDIKEFIIKSLNK